MHFDVLIFSRVRLVKPVSAETRQHHATWWSTAMPTIHAVGIQNLFDHRRGPYGGTMANWQPAGGGVEQWWMVTKICWLPIENTS